MKAADLKRTEEDFEMTLKPISGCPTPSLSKFHSHSSLESSPHYDLKEVGFFFFGCLRYCLCDVDTSYWLDSGGFVVLILVACPWLRIYTSYWLSIGGVRSGVGAAIYYCPPH